MKQKLVMAEGNKNDVWLREKAAERKLQNQLMPKTQRGDCVERRIQHKIGVQIAVRIASQLLSSHSKATVRFELMNLLGQMPKK